jgi:hypothetical protein
MHAVFVKVKACYSYKAGTSLRPRNRPVVLGPGTYHQGSQRFQQQIKDHISGKDRRMSSSDQNQRSNMSRLSGAITRPPCYVD